MTPAEQDEYVLNQCTKYLNRSGPPPAPGDEAAAAEFRSRIAEAWRFPVIGLIREASSDPGADSVNLVSFVWKARPGDPTPVSVLGTFATLHEPIPLRPVLFQGEDTGYRALTVTVPWGELHTYKYLVGGQYVLDPVNPQRALMSNGREWSRFFTDGYLQPIVLEPWEVRLLYRLVEQILPFRTAEASNFLDRYYFVRDKDGRVVRGNEDSFLGAYRLDDSVGEVNAIDKLLAREEAHRLTDYRVCLVQIDQALRRMNPFLDPYDMPAQTYIDLYNAMAASQRGDGSVPGWDYAAYDNPAYFVYLIRRHAVTAAFSHPKYGGNVGAAAWAFLSEKYPDPASPGKSLFDWRPALEKPVGTSEYYR